MAFYLTTAFLLICSLDVVSGVTTYAVAVLGLDIQSDTASSAVYEVIMINPGTTLINVERETIDIQGSPESIQIAADATALYTVLPENVMNGSEFANKTILFSSNDYFILQIFTTDVHTEGLLGIPIQELAGPNQIDNVYEYVVTTFCATSGFCQLAVTSHTQVDVKVDLPGYVNDVVYCIGLRYYRSWRDKIITLEKFDAIQIESTHDLTGTHIYSMGIPIVVYVGARNVTNGDTNQHMLEQLTTSSHWGTHFGVTSLGQSGYGDIIKIAANWPGTEVHMQGFPSFVISNRSHVVSKRLDKGMTSYLESNHPIQVVMILGLNYATNDTNGTLAMTTIPAVEHGTNSTITVACGQSATPAHFTLLTDKGSANPEVQGIEATGPTPIMYWNKKIYSYDASAREKFAVDGEKVFGIAQCDGKAAFPLSTKHVSEIVEPVADSIVAMEERCIEGETAETSYNYYEVPRPAVRDLNGMEVLRVRARVCGEAVVQFYQGTHSIVVRLSEKNTYIDLCHDEDCDHKELEEDTYNTDLDCEHDMAVYWFRQTQLNVTTLRFCFGTGPVHDRTDECTGTDTFSTYFNTDGSLFTTYSVVGLHSDAFFLMDLEPNDGCAVHVSDWRCEDKLSNCSAYGTDQCSSQPTFKDACEKYCGSCAIDSYGKKFLVAFPALNTGVDPPDVNYTCYLYVTAMTPGVTLHVSVTTPTRVITATNMSDDRTFEYDCSNNIADLVTIRSDENVGVTILYWINDKVVTHNVYPVDAFGTTHMTFSHDNARVAYCHVVSEDVGVNVIPYFSASGIKAGTTTLEDGVAFNLVDASVTLLNEQSSNKLNSGVKFISNKPIGMFCGNRIDSSPVTVYLPDNYNQILPTEIWGKQYRIPSFGSSTVSRPFNGEIKIQAYVANTFVSINGDFTSNYSLLSIGDIETVTINLGHQYQIQSNQPVAVGLALIDSTDSTGKLTTFHMIPPVTSYGSNNVIFTPLKVLRQRFASFMSLSYAAANMISDSGVEEVRSISNLTQYFYSEVAAGSQFGLTTVVSSGSHWFAIPMYSGYAPLANTDPICVVSTPVVDDNVDNDCDGLIDESICYRGYGVFGEDVDLDADFNDDCQTLVTAPSVETIPDEPLCLVIDKPPDQCWMVCECKCSWVENYELMQNLTTDEFINLQENKSAAIQKELEIETDGLSSSTAQFSSAEDERQSAANIGYVGIALFTIVFGTIFIMDLTALWRDFRTFVRNWSIGCKRLWNFITRKP